MNDNDVYRHFSDLTTIRGGKVPDTSDDVSRSRGPSTVTHINRVQEFNVGMERGGRVWRSNGEEDSLVPS